MEDIAASKKQLAEAEQEIEECLKEIETDEPLRPLIDRAEAAEAARQSARDPAEQPAEAGTDFFGKRPRRRKAERADALVQTVWPDGRWTIAEGGDD